MGRPGGKGPQARQGATSPSRAASPGWSQLPVSQRTWPAAASCRPHGALSCGRGPAGQGRDRPRADERGSSFSVCRGDMFSRAPLRDASWLQEKPPCPGKRPFLPAPEGRALSCPDCALVRDPFYLMEIIDFWDRGVKTTPRLRDKGRILAAGRPAHIRLAGLWSALDRAGRALCGYGHPKEEECPSPCHGLPSWEQPEPRGLFQTSAHARTGRGTVTPGLSRPRGEATLKGLGHAGGDRRRHRKAQSSRARSAGEAGRSGGPSVRQTGDRQESSIVQGGKLSIRRQKSVLF